MDTWREEKLSGNLCKIVNDIKRISVSKIWCNIGFVSLGLVCCWGWSAWCISFFPLFLTKLSTSTSASAQNFHLYSHQFRWTKLQSRAFETIDWVSDGVETVIWPSKRLWGGDVVSATGIRKVRRGRFRTTATARWDKSMLVGISIYMREEGKLILACSRFKIFGF